MGEVIQLPVLKPVPRQIIKPQYLATIQRYSPETEFGFAQLRHDTTCEVIVSLSKLCSYVPSFKMHASWQGGPTYIPPVHGDWIVLDMYPLGHPFGRLDKNRVIRWAMVPKESW